MKTRPCAALVASLAVIASSPAAAGEIDELKAMMRQMQERIEQLERQQQAAPAPAAAAPAAGNAVTAGTLPGSIKLPGTETSLKIYGYAQVDATHDFKGRTADIDNNDYATVLFVQPFDNSLSGRSQKGQTYATARTSRIGFMTSTPTSRGPVVTKVEGDFNAPNQFQGELATNSMNFRLRHAYGQLGNVLIGQTWSNFTDLGSFPDTVDFNPPGSATLLRQTQLRYTVPMGSSSLSVSVENPQSFELNGVVGGPANFDKTPDFTANWTWSSDNAHVSVRGVSHEYRNDNNSERAFGLGLSGSLKFGNDTLVASLQGGEGIGRYMFNSLLQGAIDVGDQIELWDALGWHLGYTHVWNSAFRSNLILSQTRFQSNDAANTAARALAGGIPDLFPNRRIDQLFINTFWAFEKNAQLGLEYAWGKRHTFGPSGGSEETGTQSRVNATVHYDFY